MDYQRQIAALRLQRTQLLQRFTTDSNEVRTVDSQIQQLACERRDMDARLKNVSLSEGGGRPDAGRQGGRGTYMQLRNKVQQLSLRESDSTSAMRPVDSAVASMTPVGVGPWPLTAGGGLLGLGLGMIGVSARRRWKPAVADAGEVEDEFGVPILGEVVFSREQVELERRRSQGQPGRRGGAGRARCACAGTPGRCRGAGAHARRRRRGRASPDWKRTAACPSPATSRGGSACMTASCWPLRAALAGGGGAAQCTRRLALRCAWRARQGGGRDQSGVRRRQDLAAVNPPCCSPRPASACC